MLKTTHLSVSKKADLTDADLAAFAQMPELERIDLSTPKLLTAEGLRSLQSAANLRSVILTSVETGDAGIDALAEIQTLGFGSALGRHADTALSNG